MRPINHGNSGGALVNLSGELVGINSQILSPSGGNIGLGFAIPSNMAREVMDQLKADGDVQRAKLGVTVQSVTPDIAASLKLPNTSGALVSGVEPGGAAARAGLKQGDVITAVNGETVSRQQRAAQSHRRHEAGLDDRTRGRAQREDRDGACHARALEPSREQASRGDQEVGRARVRPDRHGGGTADTGSGP